MSVKAIFFDLDGTLLDTAQDFAYTINLLLAQQNKPPVNFNEFLEHVYGESRRMISFAFKLDESHPDFKLIQQEFLKTYNTNCTKKTVFFPGMDTLLDQLDTKKIPWGIITNKPTWLTTPIVKHFGLDKRAVCVISGDTFTTCKPDPKPLLHACKTAKIDPKHTMYVGDLETDVITAKNAETKSAVVTFGYHPPGTDFSKWNADFVVNKAVEIIELI